MPRFFVTVVRSVLLGQSLTDTSTGDGSCLDFASAAQHALKWCHGDIGRSRRGDATCHLLILYFMVFKLRCNNFLAVILEGETGNVSSASQQGRGEQSFWVLRRRLSRASGVRKNISQYMWLKWEERSLLAPVFLFNICSLWTTL